MIFTIIMLIIFIVMFLIIAKVKTELNIANHKLDQWRNLAIELQKQIHQEEE